MMTEEIVVGRRGVEGLVRPLAVQAARDVVMMGEEVVQPLTDVLFLEQAFPRAEGAIARLAAPDGAANVIGHAGWAADVSV